MKEEVRVKEFYRKPWKLSLGRGLCDMFQKGLKASLPSEQGQGYYLEKPRAINKDLLYFLLGIEAEAIETPNKVNSG